jgi:TetR/AcrR family transcriptional regulator
MNVRRLSAEQRREQILSCSIDVLATSNYQKMRVVDIAYLVGVSEAAIYKYYPTKKHLFLAVLKYMSDSLIDNLTSVIEPETDTIKALYKAAAAFADPQINPPDHVRIRSKAIAEVDDPEIAGLLQQEHLRFVLLLRDLTAKGINQGLFRKDLDIDTIVLLLDSVGMFVETLKLLSLEGNTPEATGLGLMNRMIELIQT